ncbi:hypothetical protein MTO96_025015 [Rhipicephalus appendiculatus]
MERLRNTRAARRRTTKIINEVDNLLASNEFNLAGLRSILQRLEKSADELAKANEALHAEMTDDEVLADMDSVLEYEDRDAGSVGLLRHHIEELAVRTTGRSRSNELKKLCQLESLGSKDADDPFSHDSHDEKVFKASNETTEYRDQRYEVCLPCKDLPPDLQDNHAVAVKQLRYAGKENPADLVSRATSISSCLQAGPYLSKASIIRDLHPFLAKEDGLLRIQARLQNIPYHEGITRPIVLPGDHITTELIATGLHRRLLHAGVAKTIAELRECFWVTTAKQCVKRVIRQSTWCARLRVKSAAAPMAALPADRVNVSKPFDVTSIAECNVVIVRDDALPKLCWKLARVLKNMTGTDDIDEPRFNQDCSEALLDKDEPFVLPQSTAYWKKQRERSRSRDSDSQDAAVSAGTQASSGDPSPSTCEPALTAGDVSSNPHLGATYDSLSPDNNADLSPEDVRPPQADGLVADDSSIDHTDADDGNVLRSFRGSPG